MRHSVKRKLYIILNNKDCLCNSGIKIHNTAAMATFNTVRVQLAGGPYPVTVHSQTTARGVLSALSELPVQIQDLKLAGAAVPRDVPLVRLCKFRHSNGAFYWVDKDVVPQTSARRKGEGFMHCAQYCVATIENRQSDLTRAVERQQKHIAAVLHNNNLVSIPADEILAEAWFTAVTLPNVDITDAAYRRYQARVGNFDAPVFNT